jgi:hypothetical protein
MEYDHEVHRDDYPKKYKYQRSKETNWMTHQPNASFWGNLKIKKHPASLTYQIKF